jgi:hypothetical protein
MSQDAPAPPPVPPPARPPVPLAATCLTMVLGAGMLAAVCCGAGVLGLARSAAPRVARGRDERAKAAATQALVDEAKAQLEVLAARLSAAARDAGELPEALTEAPPKDPWGHPIDYSRTSPDRAVLRSAGPDGRIGTRDDVRRDVVK